MNAGGTLFVTDGSVIQDAGNAIEPQANGKVIVSNSTLLENIVGINAVNGNFPHFFFIIPLKVTQQVLRYKHSEFIQILELIAPAVIFKIFQALIIIKLRFLCLVQVLSQGIK